MAPRGCCFFSHTGSGASSPGHRAGPGAGAQLGRRGARQRRGHSQTQRRGLLLLCHLSLLVADLTFYIGSNRNANSNYLKAVEVKTERVPRESKATFVTNLVTRTCLAPISSFGILVLTEGTHVQNGDKGARVSLFC